MDSCQSALRMISALLMLLGFFSSISQSDYLSNAKRNLFRQPDSAMYYLQANLAASLDQNERAETYKLLGILHDIRGMSEVSETYYDSSLQIYEASDNPEGLGDILSNLAQLHSRNQIDKAITYGLKAIEKYEEAGLANKVIRAKLNMGNYHNTFGDYKKAMEYYQTVVALENEKETPDERILSKAFIGQGLIFRYRDEYDSALLKYQASLSTFEKLNDLRGMSIVLNNMGTIYSKLSNDELAIERHLESLQIRRRTQERSGIISSCRNLSECYLNIDQPQKAQRYANEALLLATEIGDPILTRDMFYTMTRVAIALGEKTEADDYFVKYTVLSDSLSSVERVEALASIEEKYEDETNLRQISELELSNVQEANKKKIAILVATFLLVLAGVITFQFRKVRILNRELASNNLRLEKVLGDKELLMKEIHHRVKNNLQTISSLLNLQSRYVSKEAKEAVTEGRNRVKSMALIHQKLYQEDNLKGIQFSEYLANLVEVLFASYQVDHSQITLELEIAPINLDVDTAVPLGLIVNELVSNSLKHAFPNNEPGKLQLELEDQENQLRLSVRDSGKGYSPDENTKSSFGMMLINSLAEKLEASVEVVSSEGTSFSLFIKNYKLADV